MSEKNLWGPPTKEEEKDLFAPPTEEELKQIPREKKWYSITPEGLGKGAMETLPMAGATLGAMAGPTIAGLAAGGPIGATIGALSVPIGAGIGGYLGKATENVAERLAGEKKTREQIWAEPIKEFAYAGLGETLPGVAKSVLGGAKGMLKSAASELSGIPEKAMETFAKRPEAVSKIGALGHETSIQDAADYLRKDAKASIYDFKETANEKIKSLFDIHGDKLIDVNPVINKLRTGMADLNPKISDHARQISLIENKINELEGLKINPKLPFVKASDLNDIKNVLQDAADYDALGNVLEKKDIATSTFRSASYDARMLLQDKYKGIPELGAINNELAQLHNINKNINKNLITPEKTALSVMGVGSGQNEQAVKQMRNLEKITGFPYVEEAQNIVSAKYFNEPSFLPTQTTGKAGIAPSIASTGALGSIASGHYAPAMVGLSAGMMGSPAVIKTAIQAGNIAKKTPEPVVQMISETIKRSLQMGIPGFVLDEQVKKSPLKPTEKAQLRKGITEEQ